jgi:hypothetical protein
LIVARVELPLISDESSLAMSFGNAPSATVDGSTWAT